MRGVRYLRERDNVVLIAGDVSRKKIAAPAFAGTAMGARLRCDLGHGITPIRVRGLDDGTGLKRVVVTWRQT